MNDMIDMNNIPTHVAMILDGNGRWAKKRMLPRNLGHRKGAFNISDIAEACAKLGIKVMSIYCFSTENWRRPEEEVSYLMKFPVRYFKRYMQKIITSGYKIVISGRMDRIPEDLRNILTYVVEETKNNTKFILNICFDYGSQTEIKEAMLKIHHDINNGVIKESDVTDSLISKYLYQDLPPVDLMIRTSGEQRISNFMLYQIAYAELYFTNTLWPDFDEKALKEAIINYQSRNRRFGGLNK